MKARWIVALSLAEREELLMLTKSGVLSARKMRRAQTLLLADESRTAKEIADALKIGTSTVCRTRQCYVEGGLDRALNEHKRLGGLRKLTGKEEAMLVAIACSKPPAGRAKWTMQLLADKFIVVSATEVSAETVRRRLKEKKLKPWQRKMWCIPAVDSEFVARMEDILDLYAEAYDPASPVVNLDETPIQLIGETRVPVPPSPGRVARIDYEYKRHGTANLFVLFDKHRGWRNVNVTDRRTIDDFADQLKELVDVHYPHATKIRVVLDNLNTHRISSLYQRFGPAEARRIAEKLEFHFTPKHASWLNMVEIEIGVLAKQCLQRRIPTVEELSSEIDAWQTARNEAKDTIDWLFDVGMARKKLRRSYPAPTVDSAMPCRGISLENHGDASSHPAQAASENLADQANIGDAAEQVGGQAGETGCRNEDDIACNSDMSVAADEAKTSTNPSQTKTTLSHCDETERPSTHSQRTSHIAPRRREPPPNSRVGRALRSITGFAERLVNFPVAEY